MYVRKRSGILRVESYFTVVAIRGPGSWHANIRRRIIAARWWMDGEQTAMILWREKFQAFGWHFLVTLALAIAAAIVIFFVWYPDPFQTMLGGTKFFLLITTCDLVLGPLTSLIIYNSKKTRRALVFDYTVVGVVQIAAFIYGVMSMADARPVYVAFVKDRFEVVIAKEIADQDLQNAQDSYRTRPKFGPVLVGTQSPKDREQRNALVFSAMEGKDVQNFPRYYVPYAANTDAIKQRVRSLDDLRKRHPEAQQIIEAEQLNVPEERLRWLPVRSPKGFWTALLDAQTAQLLAYIPIDPY
jgi:hypothetical protein